MSPDGKKLVAIISPSGKIDPQYLSAGVDALKSFGFAVEIFPSTLSSASGVFAAPDDLRASDLLSALTRPDVDIIWCARGGYGAVRTLQHFPLDALRNNNKIIVGFSDITALHAIALQGTCQPILGPMLKHFALSDRTAPDINNTIQLINGFPISVSVPPHPLNRPGSVCAPIIGGNLSVLFSLRGTPADNPTRGKILFLEDLCEYRYHIDRMIQNFRFGGLLDGLAGLIVGQMTDLRDGATPFGTDAYQIISDAVADYSYPVLCAFPSGHDPAINQPILLGTPARLDVHTSAPSTLTMQLTDSPSSLCL